MLNANKCEKGVKRSHIIRFEYNMRDLIFIYMYIYATHSCPYLPKFFFRWGVISECILACMMSMMENIVFYYRHDVVEGLKLLIT